MHTNKFVSLKKTNKFVVTTNIIKTIKLWGNAPF